MILTAENGSLFRAQVTSLLGQPRFETLESDAAGNTVAASVVDLPAIPTSFRIELSLDRVAQTLTGVVDTGTALYVSPPLALTPSATETISAMGAISFVFNNLAPMSNAGQLDDFGLWVDGEFPLQVGDNLDLALLHDGSDRLFDVYVPASYVPGTPLPLVVDIHGLTSNKTAQATFSGWKALADATGGFAVAWPQALFGDPVDPELPAPPGADVFTDPLGVAGPSWNTGPLGIGAAVGVSDDVGFIEAMVDAIAQDLSIDRTRVYATGISNGGAMSHRLACEAEGTFAAVAPIAAPIGLSPLTACAPARPVPTITIQGDTDGLVPYGGGNLYPTHPDSPLLPAIPSAAASFQRWRDINGCTDIPSTTVLGADSSCDTSSTCNGGVETTLCTIEGLDFIGSPPTSVLGHFLYFNTDGINLAAQAWSFLQQFSRPQPQIAGTWQSTALCSDGSGSSVAYDFVSTGPGTFDVDRVLPCGLQSALGGALVTVDTCFTRDPLTCSVPSECATDGSYDAQGNMSLPTSPTQYVPNFVSFAPQSITTVPSVCGPTWTLASENTQTRFDGVIRHVSGVNADFISGTITPGRFEFLDDATPTPNTCLDLPAGFAMSCALEMRLISVAPDPIQSQTVEPVSDVAVTFPGGSLTSAAKVLATDVSDPVFPAPANFQITPDLLFEIELEPPGALSGTVEVCVPYPDANGDGFVDGVSPPSIEGLVTLFHEEGGSWADITTSRDPIENIVCGETTSFSQFAAAAVPEPGSTISIAIGTFGLLIAARRRRRETRRV